MTLLVALALQGPVLGQGQQGSGSPYSAYGLGGLVGTTQAGLAFMGGAGVAVSDPFCVSHINPASYTQLARPVFETAAALRGQQYVSGDRVQNGHRADLLGLSLGIPFGNGRWGLALGMNPVTDVGYRISDAATIPGSSGQVRYEYTGSGGLDRAFFGMGFTPVLVKDSLGNGRRLSVGANFNHLFGTIDEIRKAYYPRSTGYVNTLIRSSLTLRDPVVGIGVQFEGDLVKKRQRTDKGLRYMVGASVELPTELNARRTNLVSSFLLGGSGVEFPLDTISLLEGARGSMGLPPLYVLGFTVLNDRWSATLEHRRRDWRQLKVNVEGYTLGNDLGNNTSTVLGGSFRPAADARGTFWTSTIYRMGFRYTDDYLVVAGEQLQEIGMSFGLCMPLMGSTTRSRLNLGAELGRRGSTKEGLLEQRFAHLFIGLTITPDLREQWFKKRRIE